jgi:hypothetical protein
VNTVFPGPIESERIDTVFGNMDALQGAPAGSTSKEFRDLMIVRREAPDGEFDYRYPTPSDVASTITWLASDESAALSGHAIEVTNGMQVPAQSRSKLVSWPDKRLEDLSGQVVLILGGSELRGGPVLRRAPHDVRRAGGAGIPQPRVPGLRALHERRRAAWTRCTCYTSSPCAASRRIAASTTSATISAPRWHRRPAALWQRSARLFPEHRWR